MSIGQELVGDRKRVGGGGGKILGKNLKRKEKNQEGKNKPLFFVLRGECSVEGRRRSQLMIRNGIGPKGCKRMESRTSSVQQQKHPGADCRES